MPRPSQRKMKAGIRAIVEWAGQHGWTLQEGKDGHGHWVLKHPAHGTVRLADTPKENGRTLINAKMEIRRKSGLRNDTGPAARYRHEGRRERFDMDAAVQEARLRRAQAEAEALRRARIEVKLQDARRALEGVDPRRDQRLAKELATLIVDLERQLNSP